MFSSGNDTAGLMRSLGMAGSGRRRVARRRGGNIFNSIGSWVKGAANTVYNKALKPAANFVKNNHLISTAVGLIPHPAGRAAGIGLRLAGFGKRRRRRGGARYAIRPRSPLFRVAIPSMSAAGRRRRRGGELTEWERRSKPQPKSLIGRIHNYVKSNRIISRAASHLGYKKLGLLAHVAGYGRLRRKRVIRRRRGGTTGFIGPMNRPAPASRLRRLHDYVKEKKLISHTLNHLGYTKAGSVAAALGYGRSPVRRRRVRRY